MMELPAYVHRNHYDLLEVDRSATAEEIREAFLFQSKVWHPDRFGGDTLTQGRVQERQRQINDAFATLSSPQKRSRYDRQLPPAEESLTVFPRPELNLPSVWKRMAAWMKDEDVGAPFDRKMAYQAGDLLERGKRPSEKQLVYMLAAWTRAYTSGFDWLEEDDDE